MVCADIGYKLPNGVFNGNDCTHYDTHFQLEEVNDLSYVKVEAEEHVSCYLHTYRKGWREGGGGREGGRGGREGEGGEGGGGRGGREGEGGRCNFMPILESHNG